MISRNTNQRSPPQKIYISNNIFKKDSRVYYPVEDKKPIKIEVRDKSLLDWQLRVHICEIINRI
jgi:hypothetical protein